MSPPSRGAWIEIYTGIPICFVDQSPPSRGAWIEITSSSCLDIFHPRRPPRGGRGLKSEMGAWLEKFVMVAPLAGGVD